MLAASMCHAKLYLVLHAAVVFVHLLQEVVPLLQMQQALMEILLVVCFQ
jgi:hypothetical protein